MTQVTLTAEVGSSRRKQRGAMGYVLAWLLGVLIPILILIALLR